MKSQSVILIVISVLMALVWADQPAEVRNPIKLIPVIKVGDKLTLDMWGFAQGAFIQDGEPDEFQWTNLRLIGNLDGQRLGLGFVINLADLLAIGCASCLANSKLPTVTSCVAYCC